MANNILASLMIKLGLDARDVETGAKKTEGIIGRLGGTSAAAGAAIGAGVGLAGAAVLRLGTDYKDAVDTIRVGTGATGDALADLESQFRAVGGRVPDDIGSVSTVIADLNTRTGQTGDSLGKLAEQVLDLSRLTGTDAASNTANLTRLFGDWSVATEDQSEALDQLFRAGQASGAAVDDLAMQVVQFGAPLRNIGFEFEEAIALLAKWEKEGVNTTLSLGGLKIALGEFAKEGIDAKRGLEDLVDQIVNAETAAEAMAIGVGKFGSRAGPDMVAAIREGRFAIEDMVAQVKDGEDTITGLADETRDAGDAFKEFKNQVALAVGPIVKDLGGISEALGSAVFLLPALGGVIGRGLGKMLSGGRVQGFISRAGRLGGLAYGTAFLGAAAIIAVELQELFKVAEAVKAAQASIDESVAKRERGEFSIADLTAQFVGLRTEMTKMKREGFFEGPLGNALFDQSAGKGFEEQQAGILRQIRGQVVDIVRQAVPFTRTAGEEIGDALAEGIARPTMATGDIFGLSRLLGSSVGQSVGIVTEGIDKQFDAAVKAVARGFGSVKRALKDPPQLISGEERISNMERRVRRSMKELHKAQEANDPVNIEYWERAIATQQHRMDGMRRKTRRTFQGTRRDAKRELRQLVGDIAGVDLSGAGTRMIRTLAAGMRIAMPIVRNTADALASTIAGFFKGNSPPPMGPLSHIDQDGARLIDTLLGGIAGRRGRVAAVSDEIAGAFAPRMRTPALAGGMSLAGAAVSGGSASMGGEQVVVNISGPIYGGPAGLRALQRALEDATRVTRRDRRRKGLAEG